MFGKLMSISDDLMKTYFDLCTTVPLEEMNSLLAEAEAGQTNPKDVKRRLAREIVGIYHGNLAALAADAEFERVHARHERPADVPEVTLPAEMFQDGSAWICRVLVSTGLAKSTSDARRLINQGGVQLNGERLKDEKA